MSKSMKNGPWLTDIPVNTIVEVDYGHGFKKGIIVSNNVEVLYEDIDLGEDAENTPDSWGKPVCYAILYEGEDMPTATWMGHEIKIIGPGPQPDDDLFERMQDIYDGI